MTNLEYCRTLLDAAAQGRAVLTAGEIDRCRRVARELRRRGLVDGAVSIEDRLREARS